MHYTEALFIISFIACAIALGSAMILAHQLFKQLKKSYVAYYKAIGEPKIVVVVSDDFTWGDYLQLLKGSLFGYAMVFRGIPKDFPKDARLRKLAQAVRIALTMVIILFITVIISFYLFYKSGA